MKNRPTSFGDKLFDVGVKLFSRAIVLAASVTSHLGFNNWMQAVSHISDELVPIVMPEKGGEPKAVRVVLTSSEDDKNLLMVRSLEY